MAPRAKPRPRFAVRGFGKKAFVQTFTPEAYQKYEDELKELARLHAEKNHIEVTAEPLVVFMRFYTEDKRKRDTDNICKGVLDMGHDVIYKNDNQVEVVFMMKECDRTNPRIEMTVYLLSDFLLEKDAMTTKWLTETFKNPPVQ